MSGHRLVLVLFRIAVQAVHRIPQPRFGILGGFGLPFGLLVPGLGGPGQTIRHAAGQCRRMLPVVLPGVSLVRFGGYLGLGRALGGVQSQQITQAFRGPVNVFLGGGGFLESGFYIRYIMR